MKISIMFAAVTAMIIGVSSFSQVGVGQGRKATEQLDPFDEDLKGGMPKMIEVYVEMIEISALEYAEMMTEPAMSNHTKMRKVLLEKVRSGNANLMANESVLARPGEKATVESIREYIYQTEYEPGEYISPQAEEATSGKKSVDTYPVTPPTPTAFERRNLGFTMSLEPGLTTDGQMIDLNFAPELVKHVGENVLGSWKTAFSEMNTSMPIFYTVRVETAVTLKDGEFLKVCTLTPDVDGKPDYSKKLLVFVRASVLQLK